MDGCRMRYRARWVGASRMAVRGGWAVGSETGGEDATERSNPVAGRPAELGEPPSVRRGTGCMLRTPPTSERKEAATPAAAALRGEKVPGA
eukprot:scaffold3243_cov106-Isochrysis_galbana.AAC.1